MKWLKHTLSLLLAAIFLLCLISCEPKENDTANSSEGTESVSPATSDVTTVPEEESTKKPSQQTTQQPENTDEPKDTDENDGTTSAPDNPPAPPVNIKLTPAESGEGDVLSWTDGTAEPEVIL
ncbi:MAG: hypothetical protein IJY42_03365 [Clostridia bacterium]|nr:hypothetical protein [Clostridia bacterium]